eukprot:SAG11_NODE_2082_length_3849_cov_7.762667_3_plen_99_part_00
MQAADLQLDTLHVNAHSTAADAVYSHVPLLTLPAATMSATNRAHAAAAVWVVLCVQARQSCALYYKCLTRTQVITTRSWHRRRRWARALRAVPLWEGV